MRFIKEVMEVVQSAQPERLSKHTFAGIVANTPLSEPLSEAQQAELTEALYPLFRASDLTNKTVVLEIPMPEGKASEELMPRYCAYIDFLRGMGAKNAIFIEKGTSLSVLSGEELARFGLRSID